MMGYFLPFYPPNSRKNENFKKMKKKKKKNAGRFHHTGVPKLMIIRYTVPEIWCVMDVIAFFHSGLFFAFLPPNSPKNQNFLKKWKRHLEISSFYTSVNSDHMLYCSWDMTCDGCNCYFSFWAIFCPFTPLTAQKMKISKKWRKHLEISSLNTCLPKIMIRWCMVPEIWCMTDRPTDRQTEKVTYRGGCPT